MVVSIGKVASAEYYTEQVATERHDYYAGHGEAPGTWTGEFAAALGLTGVVDPVAFAEVLAGDDPMSGGKLKAQANRAVLGWDLTFSPPKSLSVLWALAPPEVRAEVRAAHAEAAQASLGYLERHACVARLGRDGVDRQPGTGFLVATFDHRTSREGDPQLHTHAVIANVVQAHGGRRAAPDGALFYRHKRAADGVYQTAFRAEATRRLNLSWTQRRGTWEVDGVPAGLCRQFSKRRTQIDDALAERGTSGGRAAQAAALDTRSAKPEVAPEGVELHSRWTAEAAQAGWTAEQIVPARQAPGEHRRGLSDEQVVETLVGPHGLTEKASSFGRREVLAKAAELLEVGSHDAMGAWARLEHIADQVLADARVIPLLKPAGVTSGEVIRRRDEHGRVTGVVCTQAERRYSTAELLACEHELLSRATQRQDTDVAAVPQAVVEAHLTASTGEELDADQTAMVQRVTTSGAGVDVVVGKAGTGKTTAIDAAVRIFQANGHPVRGVAPSATAAHQLARATGLPTATVDRLLVQLEHGHTRLAPGEVVVLDEAGMCPTRNRLALQRVVDEVGGKIIDIGDPRQITSVDVGGALEALGSTLGATTLGINHRFRDPQYADAADLVREGDADKAIALLDAAGAIYEHAHSEVVHRKLAADWAELRDQGTDVRMFAVTNTAVDRLNQLARAHLIQHGALPRASRTYRTRDGSHEFELRVGDRVRLGRNQAVRHPDGSHTRVFNGMEGTITRTDRRGVTVELDPEHRPEGRAEITLPAGYVAEPKHLVYAYALTADKAQGATIDHALFAADGTGSLERGYVALSRGSDTNRVYATADTGWQGALATPGAHTLALHQHPDPTHPAVQHLATATHSATRARPDPALIRDAAAAAVRQRATEHDAGCSPEIDDGDTIEISAPGASGPRGRPPRGAEPPGIVM